ncbi:methionine ABC transporter ATP-binding protein [Clostridium botulinum]|uniref:D-methionine ABC transporter,ATP-binding protein n=1 Tax=Clostridium botulinum (strain Hall / ATCC 3502 / NCTC 13319 / Type A) TaxID=441771 RepID=A5I0S6_CLOBH|nr:methionine ABC transporter ATP-binding protein [Clostridium botulinum]ABS32924.1 methionine ABC transporter, MUT family, ATP-binding protein [Clostridium botulinum A str. ATCC 19397]ABS36926.1 methionine ABC transporter, MUT family, ATP-binding protein [Clostridium botulinum A str. Hall]AWB17005.1 methionine ABC transporter ATP-binding protein [Clostridium botulinum]AWB29802.1 methionine ABC transporter ATP-binding protein [Clostridium botulinum]EGT5614878.1 methionine ABC transporter ATP-b
MIEVSNLKKIIKDKVILEDINLSIEKGEVFGIVGHSGAGKSTLLRCLNVLESYDKGSVKINGEKIDELSKKQLRILRKDLGMIFQSFNLLKRKNVFQNIALPLEIWGMSKNEINNKVKKLLKLVDLEDKAYAKLHNLSGGQKQRVAIARALALEPKILLCDEATSALDPKTTKDILNLLKDINEKLGITIVIVTHQMEVIKEICERVAIMDKGKIKSLGFSEELFLSPDKHLKKLLGENEVLPKEGVNIKIFFTKELSNESIITTMARELDIDISIVWGKLEKFRENVLGNLVINVSKENKEKICDYLSLKSIVWEVQ